MRSLKPDITFSQDLSIGLGTPLSFTTTIGRRFKLEQIIFNATGNLTETITITLDSVSGVDGILAKIDLIAEQNYTYTPTGQKNFYAGDEIRIQCTAAGDAETISGVVKTSAVLI